MCDTIAAVSTPYGYSGIGIVRVSGVDVNKISNFLTRKDLRTRYAEYVFFYDHKGAIVDCGIALLFKKPNSFTGEDLLELHCHGNPIILESILNLVLFFGARLAKPGEFSLRAFLNKKIDLTQAGSIYNLIKLEHTENRKAVLSTLNGYFLKKLNVILDAFFDLRMFVEAYLNFIEVSLGNDVFVEVEYLLKDFYYSVNTILIEASYSYTKKDTSSTIVIVGKPNAGKSSLFNALLNDTFSIVTDVPGTTRDAVQQDLDIFGVKTSLVDTAGLNYKTDDFIELKGIEISKKKMLTASLIIFTIDCSSTKFKHESFLQTCKNLIPKETKVLFVVTKVDLISNKFINRIKRKYPSSFFVSSKTLFGITALKMEIFNFLNLNKKNNKSFYVHDKDIDSLLKLKLHLEYCFLLYDKKQFDCLAEELKIGQLEIMKITGKSYDTIVLDKIFSKFCIGK